MENKILISVDMDEWYQCRWATGSRNSIWPDTKTFFRDYYKMDKPTGEIIPLTELVLNLFKEFNIHATFFFTGEIASYYPNLVKLVNKEGHEIASHNYVHKDYGLSDVKEFRINLRNSKTLLEDLSGSRVVGYRAPNSTISPYMIESLLEEGFLYDSSVTPTRPLFGKFGNFTTAPKNPYMLAIDDFSKKGNSGLWEFPWPVFPIFSLPAGSGIMSRIAGYRYMICAIQNALKSGDTVFYFHPYEIGPRPSLPCQNFMIRLFLRNLGQPFLEMLRTFFTRYQSRFTTGVSLLEKLTARI